MYRNQWGSLAAAQFIIFLLQVMQESVPVLQVTRESVSGTTTHMRSSERALKLKVHMIKSLSL